MTPNQFLVVGGPSKYDLSIGLFAWNPRRPVIFVANCPIATSFEVFVLSVQAQDGSGESWNIEGRVGEVKRPKNAGQKDLFMPEHNQIVFLNFHTDQREGYVKFYQKCAPRNRAELDQAVQKINEKVYGDGRPVRR